jgi:ribosome-binding protein aMBF1 (putative translation factor)
LRELRGVSVEQLAKGARIPVDLLARLETTKLQSHEMTARQLISLVLELHADISIKERKKRVRVPKPPKNQT